MKNFHCRVKGFSLVELLTVVAIIGILAAIAIPSYMKYIKKSRVSEALTNLAAIDTFEESYFSENDLYLCLPANPTDAAQTGPTRAAGVPRFGEKKKFDGTIAAWTQLGRVIANGTPLNFQYQAWFGRFNAAGTYQNPGLCLPAYATGVTPGGGCTLGNDHRNISAQTLGIPNQASSSFFFVTASSDQDGDGKCSLFIKVIDRPDIRTVSEIE